MKHIVFILLTFWATHLYAQNLIEITHIEHNVMHGGEKCLAVHLKIKVSGYKGKTLAPSIYIYKNDGSRHKDTNNKYYSTDGQVASHNQIKPGYSNTTYADWIVYLPNSEVHPLAGRNTYRVKASLFYNNKELAKTNSFKTFTMTGANLANKKYVSQRANNKPSDSSFRNNSIVKQWTSTGGGITTEYTQYADGSLKSHSKTQCIICHGNGMCGICGGSGYTVSAYGYAAGQRQMCSYCVGNGKCRACSGKGVSESVIWTQKNGNTNGISNGGQTIVNGIVYDRNGQVASSSSRERSKRNSNSRKKICPHCHGTESETAYPELCRPSVINTAGIKRYNSSGNKCPICGSYREHWHTRCWECSAKRWQGTGQQNPYR